MREITSSQSSRRKLLKSLVMSIDFTRTVKVPSFDDSSQTPSFVIDNGMWARASQPARDDGSFAGRLLEVREVRGMKETGETRQLLCELVCQHLSCRVGCNDITKLGTAASGLVPKDIPT